MASGAMPDTSWVSADDLINEHRVRAFTLSGLRELLRTYGVEIGPLLDEAELPADVLKDDYAWIPLRKLANVLALAARETGDPYFGLKYGEAARFTINPLGYLMTNAPDLRSALRLFGRFHTVLNSNTIRFVETITGGGTYRVVLPGQPTEHRPAQRFRGDAVHVAHQGHGRRQLASLGGRRDAPRPGRSRRV